METIANVEPVVWVLSVPWLKLTAQATVTSKVVLTKLSGIE